MKPFIELKNVFFEYKLNGPDNLKAVNDVSMTVIKGSHVAVLGRNGSGKSTLARLIAGLEQPGSGTITVGGYEHDGGAASLEIRRKCGIVFQNPDNQIIGTTVEEDVAFGPENLGVPREEMIVRIDDALKAVGLTEKKKSAPHLLSGGQKQKLAIAGILAMDPECFILDEATSMLDPSARKDFIALVTSLVKERNMTVINITHDMEEAVLSDHVYIMSEGTIVRHGHPAEVFDDIDLLKAQGLDVPVHMDIAQKVSDLTGRARTPLADFTREGAAEDIIRMCKGISCLKTTEGDSTGKYNDRVCEEKTHETVLDVSELSYTYSRDTVFANDALSEVSMSIRRGELFGVIGQTGSGKSTLVQHFNGLIKPQSGKVTVLGFDTSRKDGIREIRKHAGLLFQYPEHQLFEETVYKDIAFGPKCLGMDEDSIHASVMNALEIVGLGEEYASKSPFELSGGQKRRVAIAGIIAMEPEILILDEPAAGLDPAGREDILRFVNDLADSGTTVVLVSHNMDDIAKMADRVLVLKGGKVMSCTSPEELFSENDVSEFGISLPVITEFMMFMRSFVPGLDVSGFTADACAESIVSVLSDGKVVSA